MKRSRLALAAYIAGGVLIVAAVLWLDHSNHDGLAAALLVFLIGYLPLCWPVRPAQHLP